MKNISLKRLGAKLLEHGKNVADRLSAFCEKYTASKKKAAVVIFCTVASTISINIVASNKSEKEVKSFSTMQLHQPLHIGKNTRVTESRISEEVYQRITRYRKYLDSISVADKKTFNKIITARPHLLDSVTLFEKFYHAQSKK